MSDTIYDLIGVGIGPFNLGMACLADDVEELNTLFFEKKPDFDWHTGIMLEWSTLQIPFIADLVSFANPTSKFSFLNYLKTNQHLYQFYIRESYFILRSEYNQYCRWAVSQLNNLKFSSEVTSITYLKDEACYQVEVKNPDGTFSVKTKHLVLGTGTSPYVPDFCKEYQSDIHLSANYLQHKKEYQKKKSITIVGSGQSSAEIYYDLLSDIDQYGYELNWLTKAPRFFAMDLGKLSLEMTSPDYTNHFFSLTDNRRQHLIDTQNVLYKGINLSLVDDIYDLLYLKSRQSNIKTCIMPCSRLDNVNKHDGKFDLEFFHKDLQESFQIQTDALILALGYSYQVPDFLEPIKNQVNWDSKQRLKVSTDYSINDEHNIFVQNVGLYSHGISVPDLGMGCYRNSIIINHILGKEHYFVENRIAFQDFTPKTRRISEV